MISAITTDTLSTSAVALTDYRSRTAATERAMLPDSAPPAPRNYSANDDRNPGRQDRQAQEPAPDQERYSAASMFAASVIAGAMPPAPTTIEEVILRIGSIPLPPETEARLKDLIA